MLTNSCSAAAMLSQFHRMGIITRNPKPEAQTDQIYIAGYEKTSRGVNMPFVTADGEPFYPKSYSVKNLGDSTAVVWIDKNILDLTCMPDSMAYAQSDDLKPSPMTE